MTAQPTSSTNEQSPSLGTKQTARPSEKLGQWWCIAALAVGGGAASILLGVRAFTGDPTQWLEQVALNDVAGPFVLALLAVGALLKSLGSDVRWDDGDAALAAGLTRVGKGLALGALAYTAMVAVACWTLPYLADESDGLAVLGFLIALLSSLAMILVVRVGSRRINRISG